MNAQAANREDFLQIQSMLKPGLSLLNRSAFQFYLSNTCEVLMGTGWLDSSTHRCTWLLPVLLDLNSRGPPLSHFRRGSPGDEFRQLTRAICWQSRERKTGVSTGEKRQQAQGMGCLFQTSIYKNYFSAFVRIFLTYEIRIFYPTYST